MAAAKSTRLAGIIVGLASVGLTVWALVVSGFGGLAIIPLLTGWMTLAAVAVLRISVRAEPAGLLINNGLRSRCLAWERVRGFRSVDRHGLAGVYVLVDDDDLVRLPFENLGGWGGKRRRREFADQLSEYARSYVQGG